MALTDSSGNPINPKQLIGLDLLASADTKRVVLVFHSEQPIAMEQLVPAMRFHADDFERQLMKMKDGKNQKILSAVEMPPNGG